MDSGYQRRTPAFHRHFECSRPESRDEHVDGKYLVDGGNRRSMLIHNLPILLCSTVGLKRTSRCERQHFPVQQTYRCALHMRIEGDIIRYAIVILFQADLEVIHVLFITEVRCQTSASSTKESDLDLWSNLGERMTRSKMMNLPAISQLLETI